MKATWVIAAAFALPLAAQADGGSSASASSSGGKASVATSTDASGAFKSLDKNKDGYLSRDEARGSVYEQSFDKLDKNSDGKLSREEHAAAHRAQASSPGAAAAASSAPPAASSTTPIGPSQSSAERTAEPQNVPEKPTGERK